MIPQMHTSIFLMFLSCLLEMSRVGFSHPCSLSTPNSGFFPVLGIGCHDIDFSSSDGNPMDASSILAKDSLKGN
jgi:hypothetical protein